MLRYSYRPDQGVYARGTAFWALAAYSGFAGSRFYYWIQRWDWATNRLMEDPLPVLGMPLTAGLISSVVAFLGLLYGIWKLVNLPKLADLLAETEAEMKKVTWPSFADCKNSSVVVIGCTIFILVFLFVADFALEWIFSNLIYG